MTNISAVTAAKGYPAHIMESIDSVNDFVSEIIVADIGIDKKLFEVLSKSKKVKIIKIAEEVPYIELIREKMKSFASSDYILFLDPDEIVPEGLKKILSQNLDSYDYFSIPRKNIIFGQWIQHSRWWPDYQTRLFKKAAVTWPTQIHAQPEVKGNGMTIEPQEELAFVHYNYDTFDEYMQKAVRYAKADAGEYKKKNKIFTLKDAVSKALSEFISRYFANDGYKDGMPGLILSFMQMFYYFLVYFYYWDMYKKDVEVKNYQPEIEHYFKNGLLETNYWLDKKGLASGRNKIVRKFINKILK